MTERVEWTVDAEEDGERLDRVATGRTGRPRNRPRPVTIAESSPNERSPASGVNSSSSPLM